MNKHKNNEILETSITKDGILRLVLNNPQNQNILSEEIKLFSLNFITSVY